MRMGFSLIELVVALLVSSILAVALMRVLGGSSNVLKATESIITSDMAIAVFYDRFERDISGACVPPFGDPSRAKAVKKPETPSRQPFVFGAPAAQEPEKKDKSVLFKQAFVYKVRDKQLEQLSFITCNPMESYRGSKVRLARVTYQLKPQSGSRGLYHLLRRESKNPTYGSDKDVRPYVVFTDIESLRLEFLLIEKEPEQPKQTPKQPAQLPFKQPVKHQQKTSWHETWPPAAPEAQKKSAESGVPAYVKMHVVCQDPVERQLREYHFVFCIFAPELVQLSGTLPVAQDRPQPQPKPGATNNRDMASKQEMTRDAATFVQQMLAAAPQRRMGMP